MTRSEFIDLVKKEKLNTSAFAFDDSVQDGYIIRRNYYRWELVSRERGIEFECMGFPTEGDALACLYERLVQLRKAEQKAEEAHSLSKDKESSL